MRPLRVLIDTNVLVSGVLFGGVPGDILDAARTGPIIGIVSLHILGEFRDVLTRPRFGVDVALADSLAEEVAGFCEVVAVERASASWSRDADDDPVVEAALIAGADVVVTGDGHLLVLELQAPRFVTPGALAAELDR
ncbi:MAG: putative toxin-antitoxin system toxin component, PIN family [Coriobacteriia bacterium]|nr:putative toxin-antitoxin system toxin component, PIN family [Actinomycetota bacterium]MDZ4166574.1 putative toxin-antitoxin system toxin component, PIN family [Coriobacteriia bacterium]